MPSRLTTPSRSRSHLSSLPSSRPDSRLAPRSRFLRARLGQLGDRQQTGSRRLLATVLLLAATAGCSQHPSRVEPPTINATEAGKLAMEQYDTNGDGIVGGDELQKAPSLNAAIETLDTDGDGAVSAAEVTARIESWQKTRVAVTTVSCKVSLNGQPLADAEVVFEPAEFLGDQIPKATGYTTRFGIADPLVAKEDRPTPETPPGIALGLYKVRISKNVSGTEQIPARYNSETILGQQIAYDDPAVMNNRINFKLKSR